MEPTVVTESGQVGEQVAVAVDGQAIAVVFRAVLALACSERWTGATRSAGMGRACSCPSRTGRCTAGRIKLGDAPKRDRTLIQDRAR